MTTLLTHWLASQLCVSVQQALRGADSTGVSTRELQFLQNLALHLRSHSVRSSQSWNFCSSCIPHIAILQPLAGFPPWSPLQHKRAGESGVEGPQLSTPNTHTETRPPPCSLPGVPHNVYGGLTGCKALSHRWLHGTQQYMHTGRKGIIIPVI